MGVLKDGRFESVFWGMPFTFITGLDNLGRKNASESIYTWLLPGITNLTDRVRYFGFYCWIINWYHTEHTHGNQKELYKYIRRSEFLIALMMKELMPEATQISGSRTASAWVQKSNRADFYDIAEGADKGEDKVTYFDLAEGAFGLYYAASLKNLGLLKIKKLKDHSANIYAVTEHSDYELVTGKQLAASFDSSLSDESKKIFLQSIVSGVLERSNIKVLYDSFSIPKIEPSSSEWTHYKQFLFGPDSPFVTDEEKLTYNRNHTIKELLSFYENGHGSKSWEEFLDECYEIHKYKNSDNPLHVLNGWYCYQLLEFWQFACEVLLWCILEKLSLYASPVPIHIFLQEFSDEVVSNDDWIKEDHDSDSIHLVKKLEKLIKSSHNYAYISSLTFALIKKLVTENESNLFELKKKLYREQFFRAFDEIKEIIDQKEKLFNVNSNDVQTFFQNSILERHYQVAIRKQGNGRQSSLKFLRDENTIRFVRPFTPSNTTPRLGALESILQDLKFLLKSSQDNTYQITEEGQNILSNVQD